ncbi:MAG: helix-turn-helix transcriptional regulator [Flavobacteriales bacterium]|nr:helix-turn-helix transcriptional regulator [Flavobacteriales bacterium]
MADNRKIKEDKFEIKSIDDVRSIDESLNARIRKIRKKLGKTQEVFADEIGIKREALNRIEANKGFAPISLIRNIHLKFNITYDYLLHGTEPDFHSKEVDIDLDQIKMEKSFLSKDLDHAKDVLIAKEQTVDALKSTIYNQNNLLSLQKQIISNYLNLKKEVKDPE